MQDSPITIDYSLCMADGVGPLGGLRDDELTAEHASFERGARRVAEQVKSGVLGFWDLPNDREQVARVRAVQQALPANVTDVLVLGIGGSSLGGRAIYQALCGPLELAGLAPRNHCRLYFPDNIDAWFLAALLDTLSPTSTLVLVVSKSGGTVETAAQLLVLNDWLAGSLSAEDAKLISFHISRYIRTTIDKDLL